MKLYSRKQKRYVEREVHFGVGKGTKTACGVNLYSRHVMVSVFSDTNGEMVTNDLERVTCKRCLNTRENRLRKLIKIEQLVPGIFDRDTLFGEEWIINHALDVPQDTVDKQKIELIGKTKITLFNITPLKDKKMAIRNFVDSEVREQH